MFSTEIRDQLLSNLKILYGDKVEIFTIYVETEKVSGHQAIAATPHSSKATWTKFLHGPLNTETQYALKDLLLESEKELAKLLASNGNKVPFDGEITQILTYGRGQREGPDSPTTPATLDSPVDEVHSKEHICEEPVRGEPVYEVDAVEESQPMPAEDDGWGSFPAKKGKKGRRGNVIEESQPMPAEDDWWGFFPAKKGKNGKKKGKKAVEEVEVLESTPEPEPVYDEVAIEESVPMPAEEVEVLESTPEPRPVLSAAYDPEPEVVVEQDPWLAWGMVPKKEKKEEMRSTVPSDGAGAQNVQEEPEMGLEANQLAPPLVTGILTPTVPRSGQTVVFTIRHSNDIKRTCTLEAMLFLTDTTYAAICEAVFAYLDSQEGGLRPKRTLQIRSGIGRNGKVDLSAIEESMWPVYMEYFCQYTKLPELTVDILDS
ncbi:hypothetical protein BKA65DRAFT_548383 [Rhexocercosporidium sp. MPI-PUGE-AT-0058]|nr:hypothetical protein BKA65DRAFT_548383 [Rhexocercosporidium sp. MPI-PUGE-AT-0058]